MTASVVESCEAVATEHAASDDPSMRFVLPPDAPYLANLAALWAADPMLAARIEATDGRESYPVQASRAGPPTVAVPAAEGGRPVWLHSRYEPVEEARKLIDALDFGKHIAFYVHGFGLGYHLELLFERSGSEAVFFVFEPDLLLLRTAFEHRDLSKLIESGRVHFFTQPDKADLLTRLTPHTAMLSLGVATVAHPPSLQVAAEFHRQIQQWIGEYDAYARTSLNTLLLNSARTLENIARNIGWYAAAPSLERLRDRFRGRPAIVVSAGPSLRKNKHLLKDLQDRAVIVAVQTTFQPLLQMGVEPHFVTSLDYHEICTRFFENLPDLGRPVRTELVAEPKATSAVFRLNPGPVSLLGNEHAESLLRELRPAKPELPAGATVAHLAYYLAEFLGCDPIIFIGQDLGFGDGLCYAPGTSYEDVWRPELGRFCTVEMKQWEQIVRERFILRRIPDYQGGPMYTEERLFTYLQQFERDFLRSKRTIIDATEGGAAKRGATTMPLRDAIDRFCTTPFAIDLSDHPGPDWSRLPACADSLRRRQAEAAEVERISRQTLPLLEEIRDHADDQDRVNALIARIDGLRASMNEVGATYDLVAQLNQRAQLHRFEADRRISAAKLDPLERQRRQVARDVDNVRGMLEAAQQFQRLMAEVIERLESESNAHLVRREAA
jgi:hypothetical protein